jgi:hypothetical protein
MTAFIGGIVGVIGITASIVCLCIGTTIVIILAMLLGVGILHASLTEDEQAILLRGILSFVVTLIVTAIALYISFWIIIGPHCTDYPLLQFCPVNYSLDFGNIIMITQCTEGVSPDGGLFSDL